MPAANRARAHGSDIIVDLLKRYEIPQPGRKLPRVGDSLVNYGGNVLPEIILCQQPRRKNSRTRTRTWCTASSQARQPPSVSAWRAGTLASATAEVGADALTRRKRAANPDWTSHTDGRTVQALLDTGAACLRIARAGLRATARAAAR